MTHSAGGGHSWELSQESAADWLAVGETFISQALLFCLALQEAPKFLRWIACTFAGSQAEQPPPFALGHTGLSVLNVLRKWKWVSQRTASHVRIVYKNKLNTEGSKEGRWWCCWVEMNLRGSWRLPESSLWWTRSWAFGLISLSHSQVKAFPPASWIHCESWLVHCVDSVQIRMEQAIKLPGLAAVEFQNWLWCTNSSLQRCKTVLVSLSSPMTFQRRGPHRNTRPPCRW